MTVPLQRAALVTAVKAIAGVGAVHSFERYSEDSTLYQAWFKRAGKVNGWQVLTRPLAPITHSCGEVEHLTRFELRGYLSVVDGEKSKITAENLVRTIIHTLKVNRTLTGTAADTYGHDSDEVVQRMAAIGEREVLCHLIRIWFIAAEVQAVTYT